MAGADLWGDVCGTNIDLRFGKSADQTDAGIRRGRGLQPGLRIGRDAKF